MITEEQIALWNSGHKPKKFFCCKRELFSYVSNLFLFRRLMEQYGFTNNLSPVKKNIQLLIASMKDKIWV